MERLEDKTQEGGLAGSQAIVMTDVFVSAAAALLIALTLARPTTPIILPPQADLIGYCSSATMPHSIAVSTAEVGSEVDLTRVEIPVERAEDLARAASVLVDRARLTYMIALVDKADRPITAACFYHFQETLVFAHNRSQSKKDGNDGERMIFILEMISQDIEEH